MLDGVEVFRKASRLEYHAASKLFIAKVDVRVVRPAPRRVELPLRSRQPLC